MFFIEFHYFHSLFLFVILVFFLKLLDFWLDFLHFLLGLNGLLGYWNQQEPDDECQDDNPNAKVGNDVIEDNKRVVERLVNGDPKDVNDERHKIKVLYC